MHHAREVVEIEGAYLSQDLMASSWTRVSDSIHCQTALGCRSTPVSTYSHTSINPYDSVNSFELFSVGTQKQQLPSSVFVPLQSGAHLAGGAALFRVGMRRLALVAFVTVLFLVALASLAAAPEETSNSGSSQWQQRPDGQTDGSASFKPTSGTRQSDHASNTSPGNRPGRRVLQAVSAPTATPPTLRLLREDADVTKGITFSLAGSLDNTIDPTGEFANKRLAAVITAPILCGDTESIGATCGKLFQVTPDGYKGEELVTDTCTADSNIDSQCKVTDYNNRVLFVPQPGGADLDGTNGAPYASVTYAVVDTVQVGSPYNSVNDQRSNSAVVSIRVNAKPKVDDSLRRVFVESDFDAALPLLFLATDSDGDEVTIQTVGLLPGYTPVLGTRSGIGVNDPGIVTPEPEWHLVDGSSKGHSLPSDGIGVALPPGSQKIWFSPSGVGDSDTCCPARVCLGVNVPATCRPCYDDASTVGSTKPENDCLCCPGRHFYGSVTYVAFDEHGLRSNDIGQIDIYVRPGSKSPEVPSLGLGHSGGSGHPQTLFSPPKVFTTEGSNVYFRLAARNFGEKKCTDVAASGFDPPYVDCEPEPIRGVVLNPPSTAVDVEDEGSLLAVVFPEDLELLTQAFNDGGVAKALVSKFDADDISNFGNTSSLTTLTYPLRSSGLQSVITECVRVGVCSLTALLERDDVPPADWPSMPSQWTDGTEYDITNAKVVPGNSRLILAYTPPQIAAGFPYKTFVYGVVDDANLPSLTTSTSQIFVQHQLNQNASRFTKFPFWAFRPISSSDDFFIGTKAEHTVNWWQIAVGSNNTGSGGSISGSSSGLNSLNISTVVPNELINSNFLVPKKLGEMGAFVYPFGRNDIGQLGVASARPNRFPKIANDVRHRGLDLSKLAVGIRSTIGISNSDGKAYAWGDGSNGRLGTGDTFPRTSPTAIQGLGDAVVSNVAAFAGHAAAVTNLGHLWTWGDNEGGQLGRPRRTGRLRGPSAVAVDPVAAAASTPKAPKRVTAGGLDARMIKQVAVGDKHTVALDSEGTLWSFGSNSGGQLGRLECLIQNPLDGAAGCETWGAPAYGVLETPGAIVLVSKSRVDRPFAETSGSVLRDTDLSIGVKFSSVAASARYTVAISSAPPPASTEERLLLDSKYSPNKNGQPPYVELPNDPAFPGNASVMGQEKFNQVSHAMGGRVYTWGWGDVGQLGHGVGQTPDLRDSYRASVPTPVPALEGIDVVQVSAGPTHVVAVDRVGRVYTWGGGVYGQLGHGDRRPSFHPKVVKALLGVNITSVTAGARHTVAVDDMGEVYAWGSNEFGELGLDPPPPLDPEKGAPYLTLRGWTQDDVEDGELSDGESTQSPNSDSQSSQSDSQSYRRRRNILRIDTEDDPSGQFDLIFERLRDSVDSTGDVAHTHATFRALIAGVEPTTPPPWSDAYRFAEVAASDFDLDSIRNRAFGWGWTVGQVVASAGVVESIALPQLVHRLAQVSETAAGDGFTVAVRRACRPGTRLDRSTGSCITCPSGSFADDASSEVCTLCPRGRVAGTPGSSVCEPCAPGSVAVDIGSSQCTECPAGRFLGFGGGSAVEQCAPCAPGTFANQSGSDKCFECQPGSYQPAFGQTVCILCEQSTYQPKTKASNVQECLRCPTGFFGQRDGEANCTACDPGFIAAGPGQNSCDPCQPGSYAVGFGNQACTKCPAGTYGSITNATGQVVGCTPCAAGNFSKTLGATECNMCPAGYFSSSEGSTECEGCPPGYFGKFPGVGSMDEACFGCLAGRKNPTTGLPAVVVVVDDDDTSLGSVGNNTATTDDTDTNTGTINGDGEEMQYEYIGCTACAPGTYAAIDNSTECTPCPPGTFLPGEGSITKDDCQLCAIGYFAPVSGLDTCLPCPPGTFSEQEGATRCNGCPAGLFNDVFGSFNATGCEACPPGSYSDVAGTGNCTTCPPGTFSAVYASPKCEECPVGTFMYERNATQVEQCEPCLVGTFAPEPGLGTCLRCPNGTFTDVVGSGNCTACPPGTANGSPGGNTTDACVPCAIGTIAPDPGMGECVSCPMGHYVEETGQTECVPCAAGSYLPFTGSSWIENCVPCPTSPFGTFAAFPGAAQCAPCPVGTFSETNGAERCEPTPKGTYLDVIGANSSDASKPCPKGTYAPVTGMEECLDCQTGSFAANEGSVGCTPCEAGYFLPIIRADDPNQCRPCGVGTRSPAGAGSCIPCPPGYYGDQQAMAECTACPAGTVNALAGAASFDACIACGVGYHNAFDGRALCLPCPPGTYGNVTGMPTCWQCEPGTFIETGGSIFPEDCTPCAPGGYASEPGSGKCDPCPLGTFNELTGQAMCTLCPARTYGLELGAASILRCDACPRWHFNSTPGSSTVQACVYTFSGATSVGERFVFVWTLAVAIAMMWWNEDKGQQC